MLAMTEFAHPLYLKYLKDYTLIRDCFNGSRAIKDKGDLYLPRLTDQDYGDYENYKRRALFFPITGKTVATLTGFATGKEPTLTYSKELQVFFTDGPNTLQFTEFYIHFLQEIILQGRFAALIDAPAQQSMNLKILTYEAEAIINWTVDDDGRLTSALLMEQVYQPSEKIFQNELVTRYRFCFLENGVYKVRILDDQLNDSVTPITPMFNGKALNYIPLIICGSTGVHANPDVPPMLDIATINISHYMSSADLEWGRHFVGLPTPVVSGVDSTTKLRIGGTSAWILPSENASAKYLEFTGQGLQSLENALKEKTQLMATMSARLVSTSQSGSEAAETVRLRYMSETASLVQIVRAVESGLQLLYSHVANILGEPAPTITLNKDILTIKLSAGELRELFSAYFQGGLSKESLIFNLRKSEYLDPNRTDAQEMSAIPNIIRTVIAEGGNGSQVQG